MKRLFVLLLAAVVVFVAASVQAEQKCPLGFGNVAFKVDYLRFSDKAIRDINAENAVYFGFEAYVPIMSTNFYVGMESGYAFSSGDLSDSYYIYRDDMDFDLDYVPIELNGKFVFEVNPCWNISLGGGISYNYFNVDWEETVRAAGLGTLLRASGSEDDWVFGGQFFADVNYKFGQWFVGGNIKYQLTEDVDEADLSADNLRVGLQLGFMF